SRSAEGVIHWHPRYLDFAHYYGVRPRACQPYRAREEDVFDPLHYLSLLAQRPGAFAYAKPMRQWRQSWPPVYDELLAHLQTHWPDGRGVREFIAILQLHHHYPAQ